MRSALRLCLTLALIGLLAGQAITQEKLGPPATPPGAAPVAPAPTPPASIAPAPNAVAATVNGQPIPEVAVQRALRGVPPARQSEARADLLNFLIENIMIDQYLVSMGVTAEKKDIDARLDELRKQLEQQKQDFQKMLKEMMLTEEELRGHIGAEVRWQKYVDTQAPEKVLRETFDKNPDMFDGTMVMARHILLTPNSGDAKAVEQAKIDLASMKKQIEDQVAQGLAKLPPDSDNLAREKERGRLMEESFGAMAKQKSACPSKDKGGDVGAFPRAGFMVEPFAKAAFDLKPYQMSDVVATQFGYHLILVTGRQAGKPGVKFEDAKEVVRDIYGGRLRESLIAQLKPKATIAINPPPK